MDSCTAQAHTSLEARGNPSLKKNGHALECNCMDCAIIYMLLPQDVDLEDDKPCLVPQVLNNHPRDCDCLECIDLEDPNIISPQRTHPHNCDCADCAIIYVLLTQDVIDLEKNRPSIVHISPRSRTTICVSDSDSDKIKNSIDIDKFVPGQHSPYSPPTSPYMFKSHHVGFPNYMYGVDTPLSPQKSP